MPAVALNLTDDAAIAHALAVEYLLTNSLGGFAMSTLPGVNTRRYHGLLVAAANPPVQRILALHSLIESLVIDGVEFSLSTQQFSDTFILHPHGFRSLISFEQHSPHSASHTWRITFHSAVITLTRTITLASGTNRLEIDWRAAAPLPPKTRFIIRPFTPLRDFHSLSHNHEQPPSIHHLNSTTLHLRRDAFTLAIAHPSGSFHPDPQWWNAFAYRIERDRGQDWLEDLWSPGTFDLSLPSRASDCLHLAVELIEPRIAIPLAPAVPPAGGPSTLDAANPATRLRAAASQFVVTRMVNATSHTSVIAGYPWFSDWGRDTMIAMPGLLISTNRLDEARSALEMFARHLSSPSSGGGLVPNCFDDYGGPPTYNTVDASLWFIHAVHALHRAQPHSKSRGSFVSAHLIAACRAIIAAYSRSSPSVESFNIHMTPDGLIAAGDPSTQLTWMDAKRDGTAFTPRHGKTVEINVLFHHALHCLADLAPGSDDSDRYLQLAQRTANSFRTAFWWPEHDCLRDCLVPQPDGTFKGDDRIRPNQIFAVSLENSPLTLAQQKSVVRAVTQRLLTPFGLRTLDPADPHYHPRYHGNPWERDSAYHQGTVWPWLIGPYCEAILRINAFSLQSKSQVRAILAPLLAEMDAPRSNAASQPSGGCHNQIAEVYDGSSPHHPGGCPAQAWSVAEVLRILTLIEAS